MKNIVIDAVQNVDTTIGSLSEAELHLDRAIMQEFRYDSNAKAQKLFDKNKVYEARIAGGLLNSRTYWQRLM